MSPVDQTSFDEDIAPLLQYLTTKSLVSPDAQLGLVEFGSEAYYSQSNVTFSAGDFSMQVWHGEPPRFEFNALGDKCAEPESPSTGSSGNSSTGSSEGAGVRSAQTAPMWLAIVVVGTISVVSTLF